MKRMKAMKKILLLITVMAMLMQTLMITGLAASKDDKTVTYNATILNVKGGAQAIATMTFDDGVNSTAQLLKPLLVKYDLKASLMVIPSRVQGIPPYSSGYSNVDELKELTAGGYLDVQSHAYSHLYMHDDGEYLVNNTEENRMSEIPGSKTWIESQLPDQDVITIAVPGGKYSTEATELMMNTFYAARNQNSTATLTNIQTLLPMDNADVGGWYNLRNLWISEAGVTGGSLGAYLDACVAQGGWFITGCHNITTDPTKLGSGNNDITSETLELLLAELQEYQDQGKLWVATFSDATKYLREYQNSTVSQYADSQGMFVEVTMKETTARGQALDSRFDMPLTVKVEIPEGWANVRFMQDGVETIVPSFTEGNKTYAYAEIVPNSGKVSVTDGDAEIVTEKINAELALAKGGAKAIASMTFDDGMYNTAQLLNRLCAEYGLKASLMMITDRIDQSGYQTVSQWNDIFDDGYLEPESHSAEHKNVRNETLTDEQLEKEIGGSLATLQAKFPYHDVLTFAVPNSNYGEREYEYVTKYFYAARGGACVINPAYGNFGNMMTLDPEMGHGINSWYNPSMVRFQANSTPDAITVDAINNYLAKCVNNNGWFISICHGVDEGNPADMTEAQLREIFAMMKYYQDAGMLWVATYAEATEYIRERQNSQVTAYSLYDMVYVDLTMSDTTEDGLPLDPNVFDTPLTVKVQLPNNWGRFTYRQGTGAEKVAYSVTEDGLKFAYIDLIPNGGTAVLSNEGDPTGYIESLGMKQNVAADESLSYNIYIPTDSAVTAVYNGKNALKSEKLANGYTKYTVGDINITEVDKTFNFSIKFSSDTGYSDYSFTKSVISYMNDLVNSAEATDKDKQLVYDFAVFAKASIERFTTNATAVTNLNELISKLEGLGFTASAEDAVLSDLGTATNVLSGAAFAINEKPYYVFYVNDGFTGTLTLSYGEVSAVYEVVNGYYHCQKYVIFEVENVYELTSEISIKAEVTDAATGETEIVGEGAYSIANFIDGLTVNGAAPKYESALYSYALAAKNYKLD